jgi:hypothetical protein
MSSPYYWPRPSTNWQATSIRYGGFLTPVALRRFRSVQPGRDYDHGRHCQEDIRSKGKVDAGQQIAPRRHDGSEDRNADCDRDPLARAHEASGKPFIGIRDF